MTLKWALDDSYTRIIYSAVFVIADKLNSVNFSYEIKSHYRFVLQYN